MLLKTRREFTLCYFLFAPLGMAGYAAEAVSSQVTANVNAATEGAASAAPQNGSKRHAAKKAADRGGQAAPSAVGGGLSSAERLSRLLVDGRKAYRDGNYNAASNYFRQALEVDADNQEARRFIGEIEKRNGGSLFSSSGDQGAVPIKRRPAEPLSVDAGQTGVAGGSGREELRSNAQQVSLNASDTLGGSSSKFTRAISSEMSFAAPVVASLKDSAAVAVTPEVKTDAGAVGPDLAKAEPEDVTSVSSAEKAESSAAEAVAEVANKASKPAVPAKKVAPASKSGSVTAAQLASAPSAAANFAKEILPDLKETEAKIVVAAKPTTVRDLLGGDAARPTSNSKPDEASAKPKPESAARASAESENATKAETEAKAEKPKESKAVSAPSKEAKDTAKPAKPVMTEAETKTVEAVAGPAKASTDTKRVEAKKPEAKQDEAEKPAAEKVVAKADEKKEPAKAEPANSIKVEPKSADVKPGDSASSKAAAETNAGIKLYNSGKYAEALEKFKSALSADKSSSEADQYRVRAEKKLVSSKEAKVVASASKVASLPKLGITADDGKNPPLLDLEKIKPEPDKKVAQATENVTPAAEDNAPPQALRPLSEALAPLPAATEAAPAPALSEPAPRSADPIVEADKLLRQAQRELQEGKREAALETAKRAMALDANNVEVKALVTDLSAGASSSATAQALDSEPSAVPAPPPAPPGAAGSVDTLITEGKNKYQSGQLREALMSFQAALDKDPENPIARTYVQKIEQERDGAPTLPGEPVPAGPADKGATGGTRISAQMQAQDAEQAFQQGLVAYQAGRLDVAVQHWNYALTLSPNHPRAIQYLEQTRAEYDAWVQQHQYNALELQKEVVATEKLDTPITYDTAGQKTIVEFLSAMSLITDISFYVADGVDPEVKITAKFEDQPLYDCLDIVLLPIGLKWARTADVVTVTPDLRNKFFNLTPDQVARLKTVLENKTLQRYLYGPEGVPPMRNVEITLDDRENLLIVTDSQENIHKIEAFLKDMQVAGPQGLVYRNWKIRAEEGAKIKSLVEAIVRVQSEAPYDLERKVVVDGDDLIVKDTAENVSKIEQLLLDKNFLRKLETQKLSVATYNLTPKEPIRENQEQMRDLAQSIVTVVKTILYSQSTESAAAAEGRRYWFDPNTLQITVTDYPENLRVVGDYIRSLPMLGGDKRRSEIIFLKHQTASTMEELLSRVLGLTASTATGAAGGNSVTKTLRVEGELVFRDLRLRVTRVEENDVNDDNDDAVTMVVRTGTTSEDRTIQEFRSDFVDEYEINIIEVRPSGTPGEGSARIEVTYVPGGQGGLAGGAALVQPGVVTPVGGVGGVGVVPGAIGPDGLPIVPVLEPIDTTLQVESIENMNALLIRYEDPGDLAEVKGWLEQLDIPVLQVNIETKLVEVNETRVKQFMPEFNVLNIGQGGIDLGNNFNSFAGLQNESIFNRFEDPGYPIPNNAQNASLLSPVSIFNIVTGGQTPINYTLRMLESEGVLNLVNGPTVTVENGETANFEIEKTFGSRGVAVQNQQQGGQAFQATGGPTIPYVQLSVSPQITQIGEIRLDIQDLELNDQGNPLGEETFLDIDGGNDRDPAEPIIITRRRGLEMYDTRRRSLQTVARVRNHGTIILGGWTGEHSLTNDAGIPILRKIPYIGKLLFDQTSDRIEKTTLLIFLTCHLVEP